MFLIDAARFSAAQRGISFKRVGLRLLILAALLVKDRYEIGIRTERTERQTCRP